LKTARFGQADVIRDLEQGTVKKREGGKENNSKQ